MKKQPNQSPKASALLLERAKAVGIDAEIIEKSIPHYRRPDALGSTSVPQKVILLDGKRFSVGGAKQYIEARERRAS